MTTQEFEKQIEELNIKIEDLELERDQYKSKLEDAITALDDIRDMAYKAL